MPTTRCLSLIKHSPPVTRGGQEDKTPKDDDEDTQSHIYEPCAHLNHNKPRCRISPGFPRLRVALTLWPTQRRAGQVFCIIYVYRAGPGNLRGRAGSGESAASCIPRGIRAGAGLASRLYSWGMRLRPRETESGPISRAHARLRAEGAEISPKSGRSAGAYRDDAVSRITRWLFGLIWGMPVRRCRGLGHWFGRSLLEVLGVSICGVLLTRNVSINGV